MLALIDGDIVTHRVGYTTDNDPLWIAIARANEMIELILNDTKSSSYEIYLSDSYENNFRKRLVPDYKANRTAPRPVHYQALKHHLTEEWNAELAFGMEADDMLGIRQTEERSDEGIPEDHHTSFIASIDKDLLQIPGAHYNFVKKEWKFVTPFQGMLAFYSQLLIGDVSDNIRGIYGIGPVRASALFASAYTEQHMFDIVRGLYADDTRLLKNGRLLKIKTREDEELWKFPQPDNQTLLELEMEAGYVSTQMIPGEIIPSTAHTGVVTSGLGALGPLVVDSTLKTETGQH